MKSVPKSLRVWFMVHFAVDMLFGLPLLFAPEWILGFFNVPVVATLTARLVGAALVGIGGISLIAKDDSIDTFRTLLTMKILWSVAAMVAIALYIAEGGDCIVWFIFATFLMFNVVWTCYRIKLNELTG